MIPANHRAQSGATTRQDWRAAMTAGIDKAAQTTVILADHCDGHATEPRRQIRSWLFAFAAKSDRNRALAKQNLHLTIETSGIDVGRRGIAHTGLGKILRRSISETEISIDQSKLAFMMHLIWSRPPYDSNSN